MDNSAPKEMRFAYKCRQCGKTYQPSGRICTPSEASLDLIQAMASNHRDVKLQHIHYCGDSVYGVSDLIGVMPVEESPNPKV